MECDNEQVRRFILRISAAALNFILGPGIAWKLMGEFGLALYIVTHALMRWSMAELSSKSMGRTISNYRLAPLFKIIGVGSTFVISQSILSIIILAGMLGSYEGTYWNAYHDIRRGTKKKPEQCGACGGGGGDSIRQFQRWEVRATLASSILIWSFLPYVEPEILAMVVAGLIAVTFAIPFERVNDLPGRLDIGEDLDTVMAGLHSGIFGGIRFVIRQVARFTILAYGGVAGLALLVAACTLIGHYAKELMDRRIKNDCPVCGGFVFPAGERMGVIRDKLWSMGHVALVLGLLGMSLGIFIAEISLFMIGYLLCVTITDGILRPLELQRADKLIAEGTKFGVRERVKFQFQAKFIAWTIVTCLILYHLFSLDVSALLNLTLYAWLFVSIVGATIVGAFLGRISAKSEIEPHSGVSFNH